VHATTTTASSASLSYYQKIKELRDHFDDKIDDLIVQLQKMQESLLSNGPPHLVICCDQATLDTIYASDFGGLVHLPVNTAAAKIAPLAKAKGSSFAYQIASPVAFTAQSFKTVPYTHPDSAFLTLASYLFTNKVLRERVREEGGADGSAAVYSPQAADFTFYAFRDPQLATTLKAFSEAIDSIASGNFTETDVEEAKLEAIQHLDRPIPPGRRAWYSYAKQAAAITESADVAFRTKLLTATKTDVEQAVSDHIVPGYKEGHTVTFAGKELIERDTPKLTLYLPLFAAVTKP
jgi:Zn-dependent M16 (insulinase) family peptidase